MKWILTTIIQHTLRGMMTTKIESLREMCGIKIFGYVRMLEEESYPQNTANDCGKIQEIENQALS